MAQQNRGRRPRGRNNNQNRQKFINKNQAFDSSGPQGRVRGNAQQIYEKYQALARDAQAANEHTLAEAHFQHAEHYLRLYNDMLEQIEAQGAEKAKRDEERAAEREQRGEADTPAENAKDETAVEVVEEPAPLEAKAEAEAEAADDLADAPQPSLIPDAAAEAPVEEEVAA